MRSSEIWLSTTLGDVGVEDEAVGVDAVEQRGQPQPHLVEVGVGADVGLVLARAARSHLGAEPGTGEQHLADLEQQQRDRAAAVVLAGDGSQGDQEALDGVGDGRGEVLGGAAEGLQRLDLHDRFQDLVLSHPPPQSSAGPAGQSRPSSTAERLPANARPSVTSSAYSRSPPTGSPLASRVTRRPIVLEHTGEVGGRRLALEVGVGREDHLGDGCRRPAGRSARGCAAGRDRCRRSARSRRRARGSGPGTRGCARWRRRPCTPRRRTGCVAVAARVAADPALVVLGDVEADAAELHPRLDLDEDVGEAAYVDGVGLEQVERDPLRALGTDARQPAELVDQVLDDAFVHQAGRPRARATGHAGQPASRRRADRGSSLASASAWPLASR